ncbi:MAG: hypothetical protein VR70_10095 [Rhodospirillaceae bacterium BRH_c57]|nr:MAG: hypothetical protein VR70_10095 [Rhodospirillaceae bacterium BRH_c57]
MPIHSLPISVSADMQGLQTAAAVAVANAAIREAFTVKSFCAIYSVGKTYTYKEIKEGRLPFVKVGRKTLIRAEDARAWFASQAQGRR